ncbi:hypothetical protein FOZ62_001396 [Perkinsus olseni]|uniref:Uncharacterized protein n=1 Tax=Perkinsus olseni TaxID=32597 RepID=A0A7J6PSG4_PEROL|nr:hypothetical protein FOZ62_001396 [Perkinsus olseni]
MKIFLTVAVTIINAILWEGCGGNDNNNGASSTTTTVAPTAPPPPVPPVPPVTTPSSGPTQAPGPAPIGTFNYVGRVPILSNINATIVTSDANPNALVITSLLIQTSSQPPTTVVNNSQSVPFHMEGNQVKIDDFSAFPSVALQAVENATITYTPPDDILIDIKVPVPISITLKRVPATRRMVAHLSQQLLSI